MKKSRKLIALVLLAVFLISVLSYSYAEIINVNPDTGQVDILGIDPNNAPKTPEDFKTIAHNYKMQEWAKIIPTMPVIGPIAQFCIKISPYTNPVLKVILGVTPNFSWLFFLTLIIWITLVTFFFRIISVFSTFSKGVSFVISLCIIVIVSNLKIPLSIATWIVNAISLLTSWWMQLILIAVIILALILISVFSKQWSELVSRIKENRKKMKEEMRLTNAEIKAEASYRTTKAIGNAFRDIN